MTSTGGWVDLAYTLLGVPLARTSPLPPSAAFPENEKMDDLTRMWGFRHVATRYLNRSRASSPVGCRASGS